MNKTGILWKFGGNSARKIKDKFWKRGCANKKGNTMKNETKLGRKERNIYIVGGVILFLLFMNMAYAIYDSRAVIKMQKKQTERQR